MKYDFIDESKIIKKTGENNENDKGSINTNISNDIPSTDIGNANSNNDINMDTNNKSDSISNSNNNSSPIINNINNNDVDNIDKLKDNMPVFVFDKSNGETFTKTKYQEQINIDIPKDQLQLIYVNTVKLINELKLDLALLKQKMRFENNQYYKNKYEYFSNELEYNLYKKEQIEKLK